MAEAEGPKDAAEGAAEAPADTDEARKPRDKRWCGKPPTELVYGDLWRQYRDGARDITVLARRCGVSRAAARTAIHRGWPAVGMAPLLERARLWDRQSEAARQAANAAESDREAAIEQGRTQAQIWRDYQKRAQKVIGEAQSLLEGTGERLRAAMPHASFIRYRTLPGAAQATPYVDGYLFAKALATYVQAIKELPGVMSFLVGGPSVRAQIDGAPNVTEAQIAELQEGRLPPGLTIESLAQAMLAGTIDGIAAGGKGAP